MKDTSKRSSQFDLQGEDVEVHYLANAANGQPMLTGQIAGMAVACTGAEIDTHESPIGTLITVTTLASDRAGCRRRFSVLLPHFRGGDGVHDLTTLGIFVVDREHEVGHPDSGALETYDTVELVGTARTELS